MKPCSAPVLELAGSKTYSRGSITPTEAFRVYLMVNNRAICPGEALFGGLRW